jgi:hypothetical protein
MLARRKASKPSRAGKYVISMEIRVREEVDGVLKKKVKKKMSKKRKEKKCDQNGLSKPERRIAINFLFPYIESSFSLSPSCKNNKKKSLFSCFFLTLYIINGLIKNS